MTNYKLKDNTLLNSNKNRGYVLFIPEQTYIVLGRSNNIEDNVLKKNIEEDKIEILKRPSGGETVLLSTKMLVIAIKMPLKQGLKPGHYFKKANGIIIESLEEMDVHNLYSRGISDISIGNKKILGSAIYRTQNSMFYHAVLNVSEDVGIISKYIKHPKREPEYRNGRSHIDFVSSLLAEGYSINTNRIIHLIEQKLTNNYFSYFS